MERVILDTNFILTCLKYKVDIIEELKKLCHFPYEVFILDKTIDEIKGKPLEKLALIFAKKFNIIKTNSQKSVDDLLLEQKGAIIATQDKALKEKLKKAKMPIIILRKRKYLLLQNVL